MKYPPSFLSPLLAQAKLRFSGKNRIGSVPLRGIIATNSCNNNMRHNSHISEISIFRQAKEKYSDIDLLLLDAIGEKPSYRNHGCLEFLETRGIAR